MQLFNIEDASYQELRVVQEKLLELLKFYDSFCKKHNLKYWLAGGSMIGAIREGGIIPWDDDIDVFMPREDYEKFIELFKCESSLCFGSNNITRKLPFYVYWIT